MRQHKHDKQKHSEQMKRVRSRDTRPERLVRMALWDMGLRDYRKNVRAVTVKGSRVATGEIDVYFRKRRAAIQIHGCLWHRHENCQRAYEGRSNIGFRQKIQRNVERDREVERQLNSLGIRTLVVWECELPDLRHKRFRNLTELRKMKRNKKTVRVAEKVARWLNRQKGRLRKLERPTGNVGFRPQGHRPVE